MRKIKIELNKDDFKKKLDIKDGKTPTKKELVEIIKPLIPEKESTEKIISEIKKTKSFETSDIKELDKKLFDIKKENELSYEEIRKIISSIKITTVNNGISDAPSDNEQYARKNGEWSKITQEATSWGSITGDINNQTDLITLLYGYVTDTELTTILNNYVTNSSLSTTLLNYVPFTGASQNVDLNNKTLANVAKIGIGTATPTYKLDLSDSINGDAGIRVINSNTGTLGAALIRVENSTGSNGRLFKIGSGYAGYKTLKANDLGFYNAASGDISILNDVATGKILFSAGASSTAQMLIGTNGNVGIGTTNPGAILDISKDQSTATQFRILNPNTVSSSLAETSFTIGRDATDFATQVYKDNFGSDASLIQKKKSYVIRTSQSSTGGLILISGGGNIIFGTGGTALTNQRATIANNGMVINGSRPVINTPTAILDIAGSDATFPSFRIRTGAIDVAEATPIQGAFVNNGNDIYVGLTNEYSGNTEWSKISKQPSSYGVVGSLPVITDNGNGTITIESQLLSVLLGSDTNASVAPQLYFIDTQAVMGAVTTLTDGTFNYIVANFNEGNPIIEVITDVSLIDEATIVPIYSIYRNGNFLHTQPWGQTYLQGNWGGLGGTLANKIHQSIVKTQRYRREFGLSISEYGTRNVRVTAGKVYQGAVPINLEEVASATDNIFFWYHNAGNWAQSVVTQYNNTQYDNGTNLVTLTANRYAVNFVYRGIENKKHLYVVLGTGDYTLAQAQSAQPTAIPQVISSHATLVGKIIVQKSATTATSVQSVFDVQFSASGVTSHPDLTNLNGDNNFLHVTSTEKATWNAKQDALGYTPVPTTRTITINGVTYDLSANRSWTIASGFNVGSTTSSATPTINVDSYNRYKITALAENITSFTIQGTPQDFQELVVRIKDNGTPRTIAWGTSFEAKGVSLPTTTVANKVLTVKFIYDSVTSKFGCIYSIQEA